MIDVFCCCCFNPNWFKVARYMPHFSSYLFSIYFIGVKYLLTRALGYMEIKKAKRLTNSKRHTISLPKTHSWFICIAITELFSTHNLNYHDRSFYNDSYFLYFFSPSRLQFVILPPWRFIIWHSTSRQRGFLSSSSTLHAFTGL